MLTDEDSELSSAGGRNNGVGEIDGTEFILGEGDSSVSPAIPGGSENDQLFDFTGENSIDLANF